MALFTALFFSAVVRMLAVSCAIVDKIFRFCFRQSYYDCSFAFNLLGKFSFEIDKTLPTYLLHANDFCLHFKWSSKSFC